MKIFQILTLTFLLLFPKGCYNTETSSTSVKPFDCRVGKLIQYIPETPGIKMRSSQCLDYVFDAQKISKVYELFVREYADHFDVEYARAWSLLAGLTIEVSSLPRTVPFAYDNKGELLQNPPVNGLALSKDLIWVEVKTSQIWSSSLVHEFIHIIIWRDNIVHGDPDHEGAQFSGWTPEHTVFIKRFNNMLMDLEI